MGPRKPRNVGKELAVILLCAVVFGSALVAYILKSVPTEEELRSHMTLLAPSAARQGPGMHERVSLVAQQFVSALKHQQYSAAHALTSKAYQSSIGVETFTATCNASPYLSTAQEINFHQVSQQSFTRADGTIAQGTVTAKGLLVATAGNVDITFVFAPEGEAFRILTILAAGVPIFQGVTAVPSPSPSSRPSQ